MPRLLQLALLPALLSACSFIPRSALEDRLDADGDGVMVFSDCDDSDPAVGLLYRYLDSDRDGFGAGQAEVRCEPTDGFVEIDGDCDDLSETVFPGADERCNVVDDDCDGQVDEDPVDETTWFFDKDGDGLGAPGQTVVVACEAPAGFVDNADDCDDDDAAVGAARTFYPDQDGDGFGDPTNPVSSCLAFGLLLDGTDCDDSDPDVHPDAEEVCDPYDVDEDCNGLADDDDPDPESQQLWFADRDEDGFGTIDEPLRSCDDPPVVAHTHNGEAHAAHPWRRNDVDCDDDVFDDAAPEVCPFVEVSVGVRTGCARQTNGRIVCLGDNDDITGEVPEEALKAVSVGLEHACGIDLEDELVCWGAGPADGALADIDGTFAEVDVELTHTCAREVEGDVRCWGDHISYTVSADPWGDDDEGDTAAGPTPVGFFELDSGPAHACALLDLGDHGTPGEGDPLCFGNCSSSGECTEPGLSMTEVVAGDEFSCGLLGASLGSATEGRLWCWGEPTFDDTGLAAGTYAALSASWTNLCTLTAAGVADCRGGRNALGFPLVDLTPPEGERFGSVSVGGLVACGITLAGEIRCWPDADLGE